MHEVEVAVRPGLFTGQRVDAPSATVQMSKSCNAAKIASTSSPVTRHIVQPRRKPRHRIRAGAASLEVVPDFKLPLYGADTERGDLAP
ncbi:hypothetical protein [Lentzea californiensis]|uniref:hypothetical protein n=1 Tax=Lentzea californiensis TaxID=438851 RepID=UPI0021660E3B|nr:hypothetical protein [Lentzea californiensis]